MTSVEVEKIGRRIFGGHGWRLRMAAALDVHPATLRRWMSAGAVSRRTALAIRQLAKDHDRAAKRS